MIRVGMSSKLVVKPNLKKKDFVLHCTSGSHLHQPTRVSVLLLCGICVSTQLKGLPDMKSSNMLLNI